MRQCFLLGFLTVGRVVGRSERTCVAVSPPPNGNAPRSWPSAIADSAQVHPATHRVR